jgi:hypothetical protein
MTDPKRKLTDILHELHESLERSPELGDDAREALRDAASDISEALDQEEPSERDQGFAEQLNQALERFEGEHPKLTAVVGRIADALSDLGI